jgi:uncharacterized Zn finger protein
VAFYDDFPPRSKPRRVDGGIKARSARGAIGESWWSKRFIGVLESFALGSRLTRGRSYARAGQVLSLTVKPGVVTASVQGSRPRPYQVKVGLAPFSALVWAKVEVHLAEQALYSAHLLAGEMPPEIEEVFRDAGAPLFPSALGELDMSCNCPDFAVPCKHLAATFYLLAEAFDADPFEILHWRGKEREALLSRLRELRSGEQVAATRGRTRRTRDRAAATASPGSPGPGSAGSMEAAEPVTGAAVALADLTSAPLSELTDRFWLPPVPLPSPPSTLDTDPDLLLRQLPAPGPGLGGPGLVEALRPAYERFRPAAG